MSDGTDARNEPRLSRRTFLDRLLAGGLTAWGMGFAGPVLNRLSVLRGGPAAQSALASSAVGLTGKRPILVTAGDWRFQAFVEQSVMAAQKFGYDISAYDLGRLGFGIPFAVEHATFQQFGYYGDALPGADDKNPFRWRTRALFKPALVRHAMAANPGRYVVWMDGDAMLNAPIDEIASNDYDVGVTVRRITETWRYPNAANRAFAHAAKFRAGELHAGVMFFAPTEAARSFVEKWARLTDQMGNDQLALNKLVNPDDRRLTGPASNRSVAFAPQTLDAAGACIKTFPFEYNWRHWSSGASPHGRTHEAEPKIIHFCGRWGRDEATKRGLVA
ncbi:MAG TPA: hypothetical protein VMV72_09405 [Verrucomicrobiae bacterium]|nr:hypothetical protein [Verrucomicrobiae bacterium]